MYERSLLLIILLGAGIFIFSGFVPLLQAVELLAEDRVIIPDKAAQPVKIDGELEEAVWQCQPINKEFITISPNYGDPLGQETKVWAAYDKRNLYFAFKCFDTEPHKIKTSIAQRDNISMDDQVGILLDASGSKQTSYEFYINPNGIQGDASNSAVSVRGPDPAPDFVWDSAGKITPEGYQVEVRLPLESIRYQVDKADNMVRMGVIFVRQISRLGVKGAWPRVEPGQTPFNFMVALVYIDLKGELKLEVLPNFTYSWSSERETPDTWARDTDTNIGVGLKYGITSSITAEATVNPDFSQVESDAFQVEVNQRYPIFYSEKRPFFMESKEILDFGVVKWGLMAAPIHTRFIVDPGWAVKFSGSSGRMNFALLAANDRFSQGKSALFGILRAKYNIGSDNSIGILYSGRYGAEQSNSAAGADLKYRLSKNLRASLSYLYSATKEGEDSLQKGGSSVNAMVQHDTPTFFALAGYERYDPGFYMATAFLNRGSISRALIGAGPIFNSKIKKLKWLKQIRPYVYYLKLHDLVTKMDDQTGIFGLTLSLAPMGQLNLEYYIEAEAWAGELFHKNFFFTEGQIQLFKWLLLTGNFMGGEAIYYDPGYPFLGNSRTFSFGATVQPGIKLNIGFDYMYTDFYQKQTNREVYSVNIYNLRTTFQFNKYFFVRGILRYDSHLEKLLTDFLASFTLIPGTVVHLGYGSLHSRNQWLDDRWVPGQGDLLTMKRGLFFKASYLWRLDW